MWFIAAKKCQVNCRRKCRTSFARNDPAVYQKIKINKIFTWLNNVITVMESFSWIVNAIMIPLCDTVHSWLLLCLKMNQLIKKKPYSLCIKCLELNTRVYLHTYYYYIHLNIFILWLHSKLFFENFRLELYKKMF